MVVTTGTIECLPFEGQASSTIRGEKRGILDVFGHVGLTLAAAYPAERLLRAMAAGSDHSQEPAAPANLEDTPGGDVVRPLGARRTVDYRIVILGSLVPDIIDNPLGLWLASDLVNDSARSVGHTAFFAFLLLAAAYTAHRLGRGPALVVLAGSAAWHLVLDQMWREHDIALWPFLGWSFPVGTADLAEWSSSHLTDLLAFYTDAPEIGGAVVIFLFALRLWRTRAVLPFLRTGVVA